MPKIPPDGQLRIVVLAGGNSAEREVSLESGACVAAELRNRGHQVLQFDPAILALHEIPGATDVIFPMLHGTGGEDGTLQRDLTHLRIPWLGSSAEASALTFDKVATRAVLAQAGLPIASGPRCGALRLMNQYAARHAGFAILRWSSLRHRAPVSGSQSSILKRRSMLLSRKLPAGVIWC